MSGHTRGGSIARPVIVAVPQRVIAFGVRSPERERVRGAAMTPLVLVLDAERKANHIRIGQQ